MTNILEQKTKSYISLSLGMAFSTFDEQAYDSECFKEILQLILDDDFKNKFNYAIYCDNLRSSHNVFVPAFHIYYLNSDTKHIIILDEKLIDLPDIYNHHKYYIYNNKELLEIFKEKYNNITHITSIKDLFNVPANE